ncbi:MAG: cation:proton antiporter [archaeon]
MDASTIFTITGIVIFVGFFGEWIFEKTGFPDVLWLMIVGVIIGNYFHATDNTLLLNLGPVFTTFALIFILFEGVLNVDFKSLAAGIVEGTSISVIGFIFTVVASTITMVCLGWSFIEGLLLGIVLGDASQAVIVPLVKKLKMTQPTALALTFESAISDVFCIVGAIAVINIYVLKTFSVALVLQKILSSFALAILIGIGAGFLWLKLLPVMDKLAKSYLTTIAALLLLYSSVEALSANGALACLSFGIVVGNSKKIFSLLHKDPKYAMNTQARFFYSEISFFLKIFFFVYLGMMINFSYIKEIILGIMLALLIFVVRPVAVGVSIRKIKVDDRDRAYLEILNPKGLSAAVLAQLPMQFGFPHGKEFSVIVLSVIVTSVLLTVFSLFLEEKGIYHGMTKVFSKKVAVEAKKTA